MSGDAEPPASTVERARDTEWFRARTPPVGRHGGGDVMTTSYGNPWAYLIGVAALPVAFVLIGLDPFGGPRWVYGGLIYLSALPGWNMVRSWAEDRRISAWSGARRTHSFGSTSAVPSPRRCV